jgi:hypothetical protein
VFKEPARPVGLSSTPNDGNRRNSRGIGICLLFDFMGKLDLRDQGLRAISKGMLMFLGITTITRNETKSQECMSPSNLEEE